MTSFEMPEVGIGDMVLWYSDPVNRGESNMGWICKRPGSTTVSVLVWAENTGFVEKPSVRHKDDPFWKESETAASWQRWGCWDLHPHTEATKQVQALLTKMKVQAAGQKKP